MVSRRQQQLARHSPRGIIELAYLSALLERGQSYQSKRYKAIKTFFESAVSVVPLESLFHAIANAKPEVVLQCCKIFSSGDNPLKSTQPTEFLRDSMDSALMRLGYLRGNTKPRHHGDVPFRKNNKTFMGSSGDLEYLRMLAFQQRENTTRTECNRLFHSTYTRINELRMKKNNTGEGCCHYSPCKIDLRVIYPSTDVKDSRKRKTKCFKAPMTLLSEGKKELNRISEELIAEHSGSAKGCSVSKANSRMLEVLHGLRKEFETCSILLGAFMESQARIPLEKAGGDKYVNKFAKHASSFGLSVWGLLILPFKYLNQLISSNVSEDFRQFVIEFSQQIHGIRTYMFPPPEHQFPDYDEKLEFLVASMKKSVTCNQKYVSYSLERQLQDQCSKRNILHSTPVDEILDQWNDNFENETLTLVPNEYRRLVARWIKWSLMINNLRESLASQTAVGVIGLVNSGKSKFVRTMFGKEVRHNQITYFVHHVQVLAK